MRIHSRQTVNTSTSSRLRHEGSILRIETRRTGGLLRRRVLWRLLRMGIILVDVRVNGVVLGSMMLGSMMLG